MRELVTTMLARIGQNPRLPELQTIKSMLGITGSPIAAEEVEFVKRLVADLDADDWLRRREAKVELRSHIVALVTLDDPFTPEQWVQIESLLAESDLNLPVEFVRYLLKPPFKHPV